MASNNNTPVLDLMILDTHNLKSIAIADGSIYPSGFNITTPTLEVTPPGLHTVSFPFDAAGIMILNSNTLEITGADGDFCTINLPDGIYSFKYSVVPSYLYFVEMKFFRTEIIQQRFDEAYLKLRTVECSGGSSKRDMEMKINSIEVDIKGAVAAANRCSFKQAMELYNMANTALTNLINNQNCNSGCNSSPW